MDTPFKVCTGCGDPKPLSSFYKEKRAKDGLTSRCRDCLKAKARSDYQGSKGAAKARAKVWAEQNPEKVKVYKARYRSTMSEDQREAERARVRAYARKNRASLTAKATARRHADPVEARRKENKRRASNPEPHRESVRRARDQRRSADGSYCAEDIRLLFIKQNGVCAYCGVSLIEGRHVDHITPLSRGGSNSPANLALTCPNCNLRKGALTGPEFRARMVKELYPA